MLFAREVLGGALFGSCPIAIVVAGVLVGHHSRELIDEILNAVLFVMIGLELLRLEFDRGYGLGPLASPGRAP
jgi:CPA1 family monovalent cation:H+ antiporter